MLEVSFIRQNLALAKERLQKRALDKADLELLDEVIEIDDTFKKRKTELDQALAERNQMTKAIGKLFKEGKRDEAERQKEKVGELKEAISLLEEEIRQVEQRRFDLLLQIPNIPNASVPVGNSEADNEVYRPGPDPLPALPDHARPHWELAEEYGVFDLALGTKLTGAGFPVYRGQGARLERALIAFFLDEASKAGYEEVQPPLLVNADSARSTGQLPDKEGQMYHVTKDDLYLIPTAEVPLTNIFREEILSESDLPVKIAGYTPCFRREAGSYGAHVRGLNRVHQFDKVEIVQICHPDKSYQALEEMMGHVASLLEKLELPYRILRLCGGDLGFTSALTYDFEVYSAAQKRWLEVSSVSNFETYQSNRLRLRYRDAKRKNHLAHTLNGSALALARIVAALLENNQKPDGIVIPRALQAYTQFDQITKKA